MDGPIAPIVLSAIESTNVAFKIFAPNIPVQLLISKDPNSAG